MTGDLAERPYISGTPCINNYPLMKKDRFLISEITYISFLLNSNRFIIFIIIAASDGLWDVFNSQEAVEFVIGCHRNGADTDSIAR